MPRLVVFENVSDPYPHEVFLVQGVEDATKTLRNMLSNTATEEYRDSVMMNWNRAVDRSACGSEISVIGTPKNQETEKYVYVPLD